MRRDVFIDNDSGALSVIAHDALDAIIADQRGDDFRFVSSYKALLLELYGDDAMPVRIVVDEPLQRDEQEQWLARASWRIDSADGKLLVMGGFDPDVMGWWKDETGGTADGRGVAIAEVPNGSLRVDVYAHAGSMNGRHILSEHYGTPGAAFRESHPGRAFPLWLAKILAFSDEEDRDSIDTDSGAAIGFLVHVQRLSSPIGEPPASGWFPIEEGRRIPGIFPLGLTSSVPDPDIDAFRDRLLGITRRTAPPPIVTQKTEVISTWDGDALEPIRGNTAAASVALTDAYWLHWMAALTADSPPSFEIWISPAGDWAGPAATPEFGVASKAGATIAIGPSPTNGGWALMWAARSAAAALATVPDGSTIELATAARSDDSEADVVNPEIGRARYRGVVSQGRWALREASPAIGHDTLTDALAFMHALTINSELLVRSAAEREALEDEAASSFVDAAAMTWNGDAMRLKDETDERMLLMLASPVFRVRFGKQWACDNDDEDEDDD